MNRLSPTTIQRLLRSPVAAERIAGLDAAADQGLVELAPVVHELLNDDSPFVVDHGGRRVTELRFRAVHALQRLQGAAGGMQALGPFQVRVAMAADEVQTRLDACEVDEATQTSAEAHVDDLVQPDKADRDLLVAGVQNSPVDSARALLGHRSRVRGPFRA